MKTLRKHALLAATILFFGTSHLLCMMSEEKNEISKKLILNAENQIKHFFTYEPNKGNDIYNNKIIFPVTFLGNGNKVVIQYPCTAQIIGKDGFVIRSINLNHKNIVAAHLLGFAVIVPFNLIIASVETDESLDKKTNEMKTFFIFDAITGKCIKECDLHKYPVFSFIVRNEKSKVYFIAYSPYDRTSSEWEIQKEEMGEIKIECLKKTANSYTNEPNFYLENIKDNRVSDQETLKKNLLGFTLCLENDEDPMANPEKQLIKKVIWKDEDTFFQVPNDYGYVHDQENKIKSVFGVFPFTIHNKKIGKSSIYKKLVGMIAAIYLPSTQIIYFAWKTVVLAFNQAKNKIAEIFKLEAESSDFITVMKEMQGFNILVIGTFKGGVHMLDLSSNKIITKIDLGSSIESFDSCIDKNGVVSLMFSLNNGKIDTWKISTGNIKYSLNNLHEILDLLMLKSSILGQSKLDDTSSALVLKKDLGMLGLSRLKQKNLFDDIKIIFE